MTAHDTSREDRVPVPGARGGRGCPPRGVPLPPAIIPPWCAALLRRWAKDPAAAPWAEELVHAVQCPWLTVPEAAHRVRKSPETIRRAIRAGHLPCTGHRGSRRVPVDALLACWPAPRA